MADASFEKQTTSPSHEYMFTNHDKGSHHKRQVKWNQYLGIGLPLRV